MQVCQWPWIKFSKQPSPVHSFYLIYSENGTCSQKHTLNELDVLTRHPNYNHSHTTTVYIHGFHEDIKKDTVQMVVRSYMTRDDCNLVMVDWSHTAADLYPVVRQNVEPVSCIRHSLNWIANQNLDIFDFSWANWLASFCTMPSIGKYWMSVWFMLSASRLALMWAVRLDKLFIECRKIQRNFHGNLESIQCWVDVYDIPCQFIVSE